MVKNPTHRLSNRASLLLIGALMLATHACNLGSGQVSEPGRLGDFVWRDANTNGIQDGDERGVESVIVNLLDEEMQRVASDVTDREGAYEFGDRDSGQYYLQFQFPGQEEGNIGFTLQNQGNDRAVDSDVDPLTGLIGPFDYEAGTINLNLDAGIIGDQPPEPEEPEPEEEQEQSEVGEPEPEEEEEQVEAEPVEPEGPPPVMPGEQRVQAWVTMGEGDCMANPADFHIVLIVRIKEDGSIEIEQAGLHLNLGEITLDDGMFEVSTGEGPGTEAYLGRLNKDFSGEGTYTYTTSSGTCTYKFEFMPIE